MEDGIKRSQWWAALSFIPNSYYFNPAKTVQHDVALIIGAYIEKGTHYNPFGHIRECGIRYTKITRNDGR